MNVVRTIVGWLTPLAILAAGVAVFMLLGRQPPPERKTAEKLAATPVRTVAVEPEPGGLSIPLDGVVVPLREVTLAAEVPGKILRKAAECNAGRYVTKGTLLFEIDPRDYEFEVSRLEREASQAAIAIEEAEEEIAQNATSVGLAEKQLELARREVKRLDGLKAGRIVTEAEHDRAIREELATTTTLTNLQGQARVLRKRKSRLEQAQALAETMLEKAKLDLARTRVVAPTDGIVVEDHVEQDSYVSKGMALVTIEDTSAAEIRTSLQMDEVARVWRSAGLADPLAGGPHELPDTPATVVFTVRDRRYEWDGYLSRQEGRGLDEDADKSCAHKARICYEVQPFPRRGFARARSARSLPTYPRPCTHLAPSLLLQYSDRGTGEGFAQSQCPWNSISQRSESFKQEDVKSVTQFH